jgi:hypothetical protein
MVEPDGMRNDDASVVEGGSQEAQSELEQKTNELLEFRDAGILTEAELEEQKAKLRWGIP